MAQGQLVETDRSQLVAGYVGQTAIRTREAFERAKGGVLLIDEAYALVRGSETDFGREAIDTIVKLVEDWRDELVVIVAGYPEEMSTFVAANPGLASRFPTTIHFPDYTTAELLEIFDRLAAAGGYTVDPAAREKLRYVIDRQPRTRGFGNGRFVRNLFEATMARQARRVVELGPEVSDSELVTLLADDVSLGRDEDAPQITGAPPPGDR